MSEMVKRLREQRQNVWEQAKELADRAAEENRAFNGEEEGKWQGLNAELDALDSRIKSVIEGEQRAKDIEDSFGKLTSRPKDADAPPASDGSKELRSFLSGQGGRVYDVKPSGPVDFRVLSKLTAAAGLNTVPTSFYERLMAHLIEVSAMMRAGCTMLNTTSGESLQVPKTTAHSTGALFAEAATITESAPTFGQLTLGAFKYGVLIQVSNELVTDTGVDLEGYLAMQAGRALGNAFGGHLVTGTGTGQPRGITIDTTLGKTGGAGVVGAPVADDLMDLFYSVIAPYRDSAQCGWLMKDSTVGTVRKVKDTTGQYIWQPGLQAGAPDLLLGKPVYTDPGVAATALSAKSIIFGDLSQYFVRLAGGGIRFERSDDFAFNTDLVTFRALLRGDGALVDLTGAVKHYIGNAA